MNFRICTIKKDGVTTYEAEANSREEILTQILDEDFDTLVHEIDPSESKLESLHTSESLL